MDSNNKISELKKIFLFLAGKNPNDEIVKVPLEDIIYGLDQYCIEMDEEKKNDLKNALEAKKDNENNIEFEDFRECFDLNKNFKKQKNEEIQNTANQIFFLIQEILGPHNIKNQKLSTENIKRIFELVFGFNEVDFNQKDNTTMQNKTIMSNNHNQNNILRMLTIKNEKNMNTPTPGNHKEEFVKNLKKDFFKHNDLPYLLLECIDLDGDGHISLSDFEFLIQNYLNHASKENY